MKLCKAALFLLIAFSFAITSCKPKKWTSSPVTENGKANEVQSNNKYLANDSSLIQAQRDTNAIAGNKTLAVNKNKSKTTKNKHKQAISKEQKVVSDTIIPPKKTWLPHNQICKLCEGFKMAKTAKNIMEPPDANGCSGGAAYILWIILLPLLAVIAALIYILAIIYVIFSFLLLASIVLGIALLILYILGMLTWMAGLIAGIGSVLLAAFLLKIICSYC